MMKHATHGLLWCAAATIAAAVKITPALPPDMTVAIGQQRLAFDPPEIRTMEVSVKAPRNYASWYEPWEPWPEKGLDGKANTIHLKPKTTLDGAPILGGLFRMILPESVCVTSADGSKTFKMDEDYKFNADWGQIANLDSRLGKEWEADLNVSCKYAAQRIDLIQQDASGKISVKKGESVDVCPALPDADSGCMPLAGVYIAPWRRAGGFVITADDINPIRSAPPVQPVNKQAVANTLRKLADGGSVKIAFVGASIMDGAEAGTWWADRWTDKNYGYASRVITGLRKRFPQATITPVTASQGGQTAKYGIEVMNSKVLPEKPDLIFLSFGANDCGGAIGAGPRNPPEQFKEDMRGMIRQAKAAGSEVILIITMEMNPELKNGVTDRWPLYRQAELELAAEENVGAANCYAEWENQKTRGVPPLSQLHNMINHPGIEGHKLFSEVILRFFE